MNSVRLNLVKFSIPVALQTSAVLRGLNFQETQTTLDLFTLFLIHAKSKTGFFKSPVGKPGND